MLRIKKEIDLKELKKFGFQKYKNGEYFFENAESLETINVRTDGRIYIETLEMAYGSIVEDLLFKLFDLIQAGYVEKVGE